MANRDGQERPTHYKGHKDYEPGDPLDGTYDLVLNCRKCLATLDLPPDATGLTQDQLDEVQFVFPWSAQLYFMDRGIKEAPTVCKHHYKHRKNTTNHNRTDTTDASRHSTRP